MNRLVEHFFRAAIDWLFRRRSPALLVMSIGFGCLALAVGTGWVLNVSLPWRESQLEINFNSVGGTPAIIIYLAAILGAVCFGRWACLGGLPLPGRPTASLTKEGHRY